MVRTTLGAEVETTVTVSGSESVEFLDLTQTSTVSANSVDSTVVTAPAGKVYELITARLRVGGIPGTSGSTHFISLLSDSNTIRAITGISKGPDNIFYNGQFFTSATSSALPPDITAQAAALRGLRADDTSGFRIEYSNRTGSAQTSNREYKLWLREITVSG